MCKLNQAEGSEEKPEIIDSIQSSGKLEEDKEKLLIEVITQLKQNFKS